MQPDDRKIAACCHVAKARRQIWRRRGQPDVRQRCRRQSHVRLQQAQSACPRAQVAQAHASCPAFAVPPSASSAAPAKPSANPVKTSVKIAAKRSKPLPVGFFEWPGQRANPLGKAAGPQYHSGRTLGQVRPDRLVMGSTTGGLWITENGGDQWHEITHTLPPSHAVHFA